MSEIETAPKRPKRPDRNHQIAAEAQLHGAHFALTIVERARANSIPVSLGFALIQKETNFANVFGHDPTIFVGRGLVTHAKYEVYKHERGVNGHGGMQGVGPAQLTWYAYQDLADKRGGCWMPEHNISVGFWLLANLMRVHGYVNGVAAYNGVGPAATRYSEEVRALAHLWHTRLTP